MYAVSYKTPVVFGHFKHLFILGFGTILAKQFKICLHYIIFWLTLMMKFFSQSSPETVLAKL